MIVLPAPGIQGSTPGLTRISSSEPRLYLRARSYSVSSYTVTTVWSSPNTGSSPLGSGKTVACASLAVPSASDKLTAAAARRRRRGSVLGRSFRVNFKVLRIPFMGLRVARDRRFLDGRGDGESI